ncbi:hypothetical protein [Methylotuvimicrobium buryatense]|uniref:Uncharacterized protein n=1 Tax=Methylotuvimicrobium buryatense TaxID=95641 RepID=A0A4P9UIX3_METBY|nr:hypothetical protein [Methylotuvimicrobium buryatense]QCW81044.1 hypothetical protein EQU24_01335 [Methylotuvimicrobium buryatense]
MSKLRNFNWRQEAQDLIETQDKQSWREQKAKSFSDWLKTRAEKEGVRISVLWRYLRVGRFAVELQTGGWANAKTPLDIPEGINADSLELLEKINRVATESDFNALAEALYQKKIKRPQLLKTWQIYREAMPEGQTARGRGTQRPVLDEKNLHKQELSFKHNVLRRLEAIDPVSLGYESGAVLRIFNPLSDRQKSYGYDAIMVVFNEHRIVDVAFIVIQVEDAVDREQEDHLSNERVWLIAQESTLIKAANGSRKSYPDPWGVMVATANELRIEQKPPQNSAPIAFSVSELLLDFMK